MINLAEILRIQRPSTISVVGAGGKTSTIYRMAQSLGKRVIVTTTTHISVDQVNRYPFHTTYNSDQDLENITKNFQSGIVCVAGPSSDGHRMSSITGKKLDSLKELVYHEDGILLIEADGSKMLPLKAPAEYEPQIPDWCERVIVCVGMSGIGSELSDQTVHRAELFSKLSEMKVGEKVTPESVARVLTHPQGGRKGIPSGSQVSLILNQADGPTEQANAMRIVKLLKKEDFNQVLITSLDAQFDEPRVYARYEKTAGILLAAGDASRFGTPKQILPVHGKPMVRHIAEEAISAGLDPLIVVIGAYSDQVKEALAGLSVVFCDNPNWKEGQSTSIKTGLAKIPAICGGAVFLLADQPFLTERLITALLETVRMKFVPVIAPMVDGQRANPVYFDRMTFPDLEKISGDTGGRAIFSKFPPEYFDWHDASVLVDIDRISDYETYQRIVNE